MRIEDFFFDFHPTLSTIKALLAVTQSESGRAAAMRHKQLCPLLDKELSELFKMKIPQNLLFAKALPDPDLRYFSNSAAFDSLEKTM